MNSPQEWEERLGIEFGSFECLYTKRKDESGEWVLFDDIKKFFRSERTLLLSQLEDEKNSLQA